MSKNIRPEEGDRVQYCPVHTVSNPDKANQTTGEVTAVHQKPKKGDTEHQTYTILNDKTGKETTYGERSITEKLDRESN